MRFELAGSIARPRPKTLILDADFTPGDYLADGFTDFDVICIGGGGGKGGGIDTANTGTHLRVSGGEGGGGGFHRVQGLLSALPASCPVVVGAAGTPGTEQVSNPTLTTDGGAGGASSFNGTTCQASGGQGGKRAQTNSTLTGPSSHGGDGGIGNSTVAGGGGSGGICGTPGGTESTDGEDGPIIDNIGHGGGGGAGGISSYTGDSYLLATAGGRGSYNPDDMLVAGLGEDPQPDPGTGVEDTKPGRGGGANASPLTGQPYDYGQAGSAGAVIIRLTSPT
jgi:hypothetical protein